MKTLMTTAALAAFLAAAPALAEDAKPVQPAAPAQTNTTATTPAPAAVAANGQMFINQQADNTALASNWIGKNVYNSAGDTVGDVNDLVIGADGKITAVVIGVGGFLGIGEKSVAIAFDSVQASSDQSGALKLTINASKDQLDAAPDFVTLAALRVKESAPAPATDTTNPAAPAPAAPAQ